MTKIEKIIESFPPALYFLLSLAALLFIFAYYYYFQFSNTIHSIIYVVFTIINLPIGLGVFFYSYSHMRTYSPKHVWFYHVGIPIPIDTLMFGTFILLGGLHIILFTILIGVIIMRGFSIPSPLEVKNLIEQL